jgi:16S rRNA (uracil1498-N3)-methyltransferase
VNRAPQSTSRLASPVALERWLAEFPGDGTRLFLDPMADSGLSAIGCTAAVTVLIGPEGGLSPRERELAAKREFQSARVGPRVLRTETAAIAAIRRFRRCSGRRLIQ